MDPRTLSMSLWGPVSRQPVTCTRFKKALEGADENEYSEA